MNEITIKQPALLECDFEAIKAHLEAELLKYSSLSFTEDTKQEAKKSVAELRKDQKLFSDRVKAVKAEYMKPYEEFYKKACELLELYEAPINAINAQIDAFEEKRKVEKREHIANLYNEMIPEEELKAILPLSRIYDSKWENATVNDKQIKEAMLNTKVAVKNSIEALQNMDSEKTEEAIEAYKRTLDFNASVAMISQYEKQKKEILAREEAKRKQEEEERIKREAKLQAEAEQQALRAKELAEKREAEEREAIKVQAQQEVIEALTPAITEEPAKSYTYILKLTNEAKEKFELYLNSVGIEFEEFNPF